MKCVMADSARSDVFFMCDGQWRSNDWQSVGVNTAARRQKSTVGDLNQREVFIG